MLVRRCLQKWRQSHMLLAKILRSQRRPRVVQDLSYLGKLFDPSTACRLCLEEKIQKLLVASRGEEAGCTLQWMLLFSQFSRNEFPNISFFFEGQVYRSNASSRNLGATATAHWFDLSIHSTAKAKLRIGIQIPTLLQDACQRSAWRTGFPRWMIKCRPYIYR